MRRGLCLCGTFLDDGAFHATHELTWVTIISVDIRAALPLSLPATRAMGYLAARTPIIFGANFSSRNACEILKRLIGAKQGVQIGKMRRRP